MPIKQQGAKTVNPHEETRRQAPLVGLPIGEAEDGDVCEEGTYCADYSETYQQPEPKPKPPQPKPQRPQRNKQANSGVFIHPAKMADPPKERYQGKTADDHKKVRSERERFQVGRDHKWEVYDVIAALNECREAYSVPDDVKGYNLHMVRFPIICRTGIDALRAQATEPIYKPGRHPTIACCIHASTAPLASHDGISRLFASKDRLDIASPDLPGPVSKLVAKWITEPLDIPLAGEQQQALLPLDISRFLGRCHDDIGLEISSLGVVLCMITMSEQEMVNRDAREEMRKTVDDFLINIAVRADITEAIMDRLGV